MAIAVPIAVDGALVGTGFFAGTRDKKIAVVTTLHHLGRGTRVEVVVPPHGGDVAQPQPYPQSQAPTILARVVFSDPLLDLAVLMIPAQDISVGLPRFAAGPYDTPVGEPVLVVGYPFAPIGSLLETVQVAHVSALGQRMMAGGIMKPEIILAVQTHPGSSGSPIIRRADGLVCGVLRGCLAPPSVISVGNLPLATDTSVTYAVSGSVVPQLLADAFDSDAA